MLITYLLSIFKFLGAGKKTRHIHETRNALNYRLNAVHEFYTFLSKFDIRSLAHYGTP